MRTFVCGPYHPDATLLLRPDRPSACPIGTVGVCVVTFKGFRQRSTGPKFPLQRAECRPHSTRFTIYPPGHPPHGRAAWLNAAPDGDIAEGPGDTVFRASFDLVRGVNWPVRANESDGYVHTLGTAITQERKVAQACHFFGILPAQSDELRERSGACLDVPVMILRDAATRIRAGPDFKNHAEVVVAVFQSVRPALSKFLAQRAQVGLWKPPSRSRSENTPERSSASS